MLNMGDLFFQLFFRFGVLTTMVHEFGHLISLKAMGYTGEIRSTVLNAVYPTQYALMSASELNVFYFSGGIFQALIFYIMCLRNSDKENLLANKMIVIQGVVYAVFEGFAPRAWWEFGSVGGLILSFVFMTVVLIAKSKPTQ